MNKVHPEQDGKGGFGRNQLFGDDGRHCEGHGRGKNEQRSRAKAVKAGPNDNNDTERAQHNAPDATERHALSQKQHGEHRHPDRRGEFEGKYGGKRQKRDGERPSDLGPKMDGAAQTMQLDPSQAEFLPQRPVHNRKPGEYQDARKTAHRHHLKHVQITRQGANRYGRGQKREQRPGHPDHDASKISL